jgi:hypothetical protein
LKKFDILIQLVGRASFYYLSNFQVFMLPPGGGIFSLCAPCPARRWDAVAPTVVQQDKLLTASQWCGLPMKISPASIILCTASSWWLRAGSREV